MSEVFTAGTTVFDRATLLQSKWGWFLALGVVLILCGALAVALPAISTVATSMVLGIALMVAGAAKMIQSLRVKAWNGFIWQELTGAVELVGGILVYFNPLKGALAISLLLAMVFLVQGLLTIALAYRVRQQDGRFWFLLSGMVAAGAGVLLIVKLPHIRHVEPGIIVGSALLVAGCAYAAIALTMRRARR